MRSIASQMPAVAAALGCAAILLAVAGTLAVATPVPPVPPAPPALPNAIPGVRLIAFTTVDPQARDKSGLGGLGGLTNSLDSGLTSTPSAPPTPADRLGSMGSGIDYVGARAGQPNRYLLLDDRGPRDGAESFQCRFQEADIVVVDGRNPSVTFTLQSTRLLFSGDRPLLGLAAKLDSPDTGPARLDPEGIRLLPDGSVLISDEYGPGLYRFDRSSGKLLQTYTLPAAFAAEKPDADPKIEAKATKGRLPNNGLEGLAVSPTGDKAFALMQAGLIQDGGKGGENLRLIEINLATGATRQFVYPITTPGHRTNEILAIDDHSFLVIERDDAAGRAAKGKAIMVADLRGATDISARQLLPEKASSLAAAGIVPMRTRRLFNLLDFVAQVDASNFPAKVEGLAFGPDLPTGERCLIVTSDNDFKDTEPTYIWAIAIQPSVLKAASNP